MAEPFAVDPELLADTLERMVAFQNVSESLLAEIDAEVKKLHITWSGNAAAAQKQSHEEWVRGAAVMRKALGQLHVAGTGAHQNYTGVIATNQKMWS